MTRPLVLLPGFDGTGILFAKFKAAIGEQHSVSIASYRDEVFFEDYVESAAALLPAKPCVLVAESFSGPIAMALAQRHPAKVQTLVLCASFLVSPWPWLTRIGGRIPTRLLHPGAAARVVLEKLCLNGEPAQLVQDAFDVAASVPAIRIKQRLELLSLVDMRRTATSITMRTLILEPTRDRLVSQSSYRALSYSLRSAQKQKIRGPHLLLQSNPETCWHAIQDFMTLE